MTLSSSTRVFSLRVILFTILCGSKIGTAGCMIDLLVRYGEARLAMILLNALLSSSLVFVFAYLWARSWPDRRSFNAGTDHRLKCFFIVTSWIVSLETMLAGAVLLCYSRFNGEPSALWYLLLHCFALLALPMIGVDVYCDRRTNAFLFDTLTEKSQEKTSDNEHDVYAKRAIVELQTLIAEK